jgi:predicted AlkP superfamily pyrophosphatase or phosphodiesterase
MKKSFTDKPIYFIFLAIQAQEKTETKTQKVILITLDGLRCKNYLLEPMLNLLLIRNMLKIH